MSKHSRKIGEPLVEWFARWAISFVLFLIESAWVYLVWPILTALGALLLDAVRFVLKFASKYFFMAIAFVAALVAVVWLWSMDWDVVKFFELLKNIWP